MTKEVLITGAAGFIGRHLVLALKQHGWNVRAAVRNRDQFALLPEGVTAVEVGEIDGKTNWKLAVSGVEMVIHLAGLASSSKFTKEQYQRVNVDGTVNLARQAIKLNVRHFIFMSSIHAVAFLSNQALTEDTSCHPHSLYGQSKLEAERALMNVTGNANMNWTILRSAPVYGLGHRGNLDWLIRLVRSGFPLPFAGIRNRRSVIYVDNLSDVILKILGNPKALNQIFMVSNEEVMSTPELLKLISEAINQQCILFYLPLAWLKFLGSVGDFLKKTIGLQMPLNGNLVDGLLGSLYCDCTYIRQTLGWNAPISIAQGFRQMNQTQRHKSGTY
jgi:nucleoside-diphosphate-sugar epimerase